MGEDELLASEFGEDVSLGKTEQKGKRGTILE